MLLKILACDQGTGMVWLDMEEASLKPDSNGGESPAGSLHGKFPCLTCWNFPIR